MLHMYLLIQRTAFFTHSLMRACSRNPFERHRLATFVTSCYVGAPRR
jgi:hypothetical protein